MFNPIEFNPFQPNPYTMSIMQSAEDTEKVVETFEQLLRNGVKPDTALEQAFEDNDVDPEDLTSPDLHYLNKRVESLAAAAFNNY